MPVSVDVFATAARVLHLLLTGLWLGAGALCGLLVVLVPETLESQQAAEAVLSATRTRVDTFGLIAGPIALLSLAVGWAPLMVPMRGRALLTLAATGAAGFSGQYVQPKMQQMMAAMGRPIEDLPATDPLVVQYSDLANISLVALGVQVAVALILMVVGVAVSRPKKRYGLEL